MGKTLGCAGLASHRSKIRCLVASSLLKPGLPGRCGSKGTYLILRAMFHVISTVRKRLAIKLVQEYGLAS
jgi:hypothetical protein